MYDFVTNRTAITPGLRTEKVAGRTFVVAPAVMAVPGILNNEMVELTELARAARTGNGAPIVIRHPKDDAGGPVSANSPYISNIGYIYNLEATDRLRGEAWIDVDLANLTAEGQDVLRRVQAGEILENSLGWWRDPQPSGQSGFSAYARNIVIDHYAILPDEAGACSVNDGCGVPRVNSQDAGCGCQDDLAGRATGVATNPPLGERILERLSNIWEHMMGMNNNSERTALVDRLAAVQSIGLTAEQLGALDDDVLAAFDRASAVVAAPEPVVAANADNAGNGVIGVAPDNAELESLRTTVANLTAAVEQLTASAGEQQAAQRQERIAALAANSAVDFTTEELEGFNDAQLEVLAGKLRANRFGGRPAPGSLSVNGSVGHADDGAIIEMPMPTYQAVTA